MLGSAERESFARQGCWRWGGLHASARMGALKEDILRELSRLKVWEGGKRVGAALQGQPPFQQIARLSSMVKLDVHDALCTPEVHRAIQALTGRTPVAEQGSQLLLSLPHQGRWSLNALNWHVDVSASPDEAIPGIQAFYLIDDLAPRGGATLALARSHRWGTEQSRQLRASLKQAAEIEPVLRAGDAELIEMSGRAGDVYLMDMRVLHTPSINASKHIRMMATTRFALRG